MNVFWNINFDLFNEVEEQSHVHVNHSSSRPCFACWKYGQLQLASSIASLHCLFGDSKFDFVSLHHLGLQFMPAQEILSALWDAEVLRH